MVLKPIYVKIVLEMKDIQEIKSETGLVYHKDMSQVNNTTLLATVVAVGEGRLLSDGSVKPLIVKVGDTVVVSKHQGESFNDGKKDYTIVSESHILSIVNEEEK